jgi:hypothetical protein
MRDDAVKCRTMLHKTTRGTAPHMQLWGGSLLLPTITAHESSSSSSASQHPHPQPQPPQAPASRGDSRPDSNKEGSGDGGYHLF